MTEKAGVTLRRKDAHEFTAWKEASVASYAEDLARSSGRPLSQALVKAAADFDELLPDGADSPGTWVMSVVSPDGTDIGVLWLGPHPQIPDRGYVYEIAIDEPYRRRGYARAAMAAAEEIARSAGWTALGLNVFGFNEGARRLYESIGYDIVATQMSKTL